MSRDAIMIKPDTRDGFFAILDDRGDPVGAGIARPSSVVGYVTLVVLSPNAPFPALRVPADWISMLSEISDDQPG